MANPVRELPAHYRETLRLVLTERRILLTLNLLAFVPLLLALVGTWLWLAATAPLRSTVPPVEVNGLLAVLLVIVIVFPLHEALHGVVIALVGHRPRFGMKLDKGMLYATADQALFRRSEYLAVALAPLVGITLFGLGLLLVVPEGWQWYIQLGIALNAGGAIGDLWMSAVLLRQPASVLVRDVEDGFIIYDEVLSAKC